MADPDGKFQDETQALVTGFLLGHLMSRGVDVAPVTIEGDYTRRLVVTFDALGQQRTATLLLEKIETQPF